MRLSLGRKQVEVSRYRDFVDAAHDASFGFPHLLLIFGSNRAAADPTRPGTSEVEPPDARGLRSLSYRGLTLVHASNVFMWASQRMHNSTSGRALGRRCRFELFEWDVDAAKPHGR